MQHRIRRKVRMRRNRMKNRIKTWKAIVLCLVALIPIVKICDIAYASEADDYTTITVEAEDAESGVYKYAIDATDETCWQDSNIFYVSPGSKHIVYVKDAAGNITSQEVYAEKNVIEEIGADSIVDSISQSDNLEMSDNNDKQYLEGEGDGTGTITDYVNNNNKEYYTVTTTNGNSFYLIIDHRNNDSNVYFTKPVSEMDLLSLASEAGQIEENQINVKEEIKNTQDDVPLEQTEEVTKKSNALVENMPIIVIAVVIAGAYYYFMIYKKKKNDTDDYDEEAADMDQFIPVDEDDDAALFAYKGNKSSEEEVDDEDYLDEFYKNNEDDFEDNQEQEEMQDEELTEDDEITPDKEDEEALGLYDNEEDEQEEF